jgi:hypothetical protein
MMSPPTLPNGDTRLRLSVDLGESPTQDLLARRALTPKVDVPQPPPPLMSYAGHEPSDRTAATARRQP